jgi:simple sugar transport system substrate-binding protein
VGIDAISPKARPEIPDSIIQLVKQRRDEMIAGTWDPFTAHEFVSNGTGVALDNLPIPPKGTVVKKAGEKPTDEWLLSQFNFDLEGMNVLQ